MEKPPALQTHTDWHLITRTSLLVAFSRRKNIEHSRASVPLILKWFLEKYMREKYSFFISSYALLMYWMQKKGVIDFSVNLYCWLSLEILSLSSTFYDFFIQKSVFVVIVGFFFWLRAENVSRTHTRTHKSIYKYIFISPSFPVYVSYTTIFSLYVLKVLDMSGKKVFFAWLRQIFGWTWEVSVADECGCRFVWLWRLVFQTHCEWRRFLSVRVMPVATMAWFSSVILSHMSSVSVCARMYAYHVYMCAVECVCAHAGMWAPVCWWC